MHHEVIQFRHTLIDVLRDPGVQDTLTKRIAGHEDSAVTLRIHGSRSPLKAMLDALHHIIVTDAKLLADVRTAADPASYI